MTVSKKLKPKFWDYVDAAAGPFGHLFNFRRIWKLAVLLTAGVALVPLVAITALDYQVTQKSIESEIALRTSRMVSNTRRAVASSPFDTASAKCRKFLRLFAPSLKSLVMS